MALLSVDPRDPTPIYAQLERGLRAAIATSRVRPGDQLPTVRQLAVELRINANTVQTISKKGGKVTTTQSSVVSSDGKTRTVTTKGPNGSGQQVNNVAVYDKQ